MAQKKDKAKNLAKFKDFVDDNKFCLPKKRFKGNTS